MASALVGLANVTLGANASTITFSSIDQTYRDLLIIMNLKTSAGSDNVAFRVNGLTTLYGFNMIDGNNVTVNANTTYNTTYGQVDQNYASVSSSTFNAVTMYIADYSATDRRKTAFIKGMSGDGWQLVNNGARTPATAAITSIVFSLASWQFLAGSSIELYGVTA